MGISEHSEKSPARRCAIVLCNMSRVLRTLLRSHAMLPAQVRTCLMLQKHWFFYRAVVIPMQCSRSPWALDDIATHSRLGGQHGEEAKEEREGSEEGRKEDQAPEEEVSARRASVFDFERRR